MSADPRDPRARRARVVLEIAIAVAGMATSFALLRNPTFAKGGAWLALFLAAIAFANLQRETPR